MVLGICVCHDPSSHHIGVAWKQWTRPRARSLIHAAFNAVTSLLLDECIAIILVGCWRFILWFSLRFFAPLCSLLLSACLRWRRRHERYLHFMYLCNTSTSIDNIEIGRYYIRLERTSVVWHAWCEIEPKRCVISDNNFVSNISSDVFRTSDLQFRDASTKVA